MPSAKEQIAKILQDQPDDSSYDELLRELAFARIIERGLEDSDAGRTINHEEMGRRIKTRRADLRTKSPSWTYFRCISVSSTSVRFTRPN